MSRPSDSPFIVYDDEFNSVLGETPRLVKVVDVDAHEGPVYVADEDALYFTTVPQPTDDPIPGFRTVAIKRLAVNGDHFPLDPSSLSVVRASANMAKRW